MSLSVLSIDPSLRSTGISLLTIDPENDVFDVKLSTLKSVKGDERMEVFRNQFTTIHRMCKSNKVVFGVVEGYSYNSGGNAHTYVIEAGAACRLGLSVNGIPLVEIPPPLWKREVLKNGQASKKEVRDKVSQMMKPNLRPKEAVSRLFVQTLKKSGSTWSTPDELDSLLIAISFFRLLIKQEEYFHAHIRAHDTLKEVREAMIELLTKRGLVQFSRRRAKP